MFGKPKFDLPPLPPELVEAVKAAMDLAEQQFSGAEGAKKREFVKGKVKEAAKRLDPSSFPHGSRNPSVMRS